MTCRRRSSWAAAGSLRMSTCLMPAQFGASQPQLKTMRAGSITALPGPPIAHAQDGADRSGKTAALQTSYVHACQPVWQPNQTGQKLLATYLEGGAPAPNDMRVRGGSAARLELLAQHFQLQPFL